MTAKIFRPNEPRSYPELPSAFVFSPAWLSLQSSAPPGSAPGLETPSLQAFPSILVLVTCAASALPWSSCSLPGPWGPQKTEGRWGFQGRAEHQRLRPLPSWATPGAILHLPPGPRPAGSRKREAEESWNPGWEAATRHRSKASDNLSGPDCLFMTRSAPCTSETPRRQPSDRWRRRESA